jgi:hypothetical protein
VRFQTNFQTFVIRDLPENKMFVLWIVSFYFRTQIPFGALFLFFINPFFYTHKRTDEYACTKCRKKKEEIVWLIVCYKYKEVEYLEV